MFFFPFGLACFLHVSDVIDCMFFYHMNNFVVCYNFSHDVDMPGAHFRSWLNILVFVY